MPINLYRFNYDTEKMTWDTFIAAENIEQAQAFLKKTVQVKRVNTRGHEGRIDAITPEIEGVVHAKVSARIDAKGQPTAEKPKASDDTPPVTSDDTPPVTPPTPEEKPKQKYVANMNKEQLIEKAGELGINVDPSSTNDVLKDAINIAIAR